jgi:C1A family cysteine protease
MEATKINSRSNKWYGWVPDLPDNRDRVYSMMPPSTDLPTSIDLEPQCPPVYDQSNLGSCTAQGIAGSMEFLVKKQGEVADFIPSRLFIYYNERKIESTTSVDGGAMIRDGIKSVATQGVCHETSWPYDIKKFKNQPTKDCYTEAKKFEALNYSRVPQDLNTMKSILAQGLPFVFGFSVYTYFESQEMLTKGVLDVPKPDEKLLGGHCVVAVGYSDEKKAFKIRNSWGADWGLKGYFWMSYDYVLSNNLCDDLWVIRTTS